MCILIVKPSGVPVPAERILFACMAQNPHGFGFVTPKTYFRTLYSVDFINKVQTINDNEPALIHCRYATHGSVIESNAHPFVAGDWGFAHNGIIHTITNKKGKTDSETAFRLLLPVITEYGIEKRNVQELINLVRGEYSKFAFLNRKTTKIYTFGKFENIDDCLFSNLNWTLKYKSKYKYN